MAHERGFCANVGGWDKSFFGGVGRMWRDGGGIVAVSRFYGCKMGLIY